MSDILGSEKKLVQMPVDVRKARHFEIVPWKSILVVVGFGMGGWLGHIINVDKTVNGDISLLLPLVIKVCQKSQT